MKKLLKDKKGFTLVEILVVLAILAILIAIAVPTMIGALNDAKDKASLADARTAYIAYELKKSTSDPTLDDIKEYMDRSKDSSIVVAYEEKTADGITKLAKFYYKDANLKDKYIQIEMGNQAKVVKGTIPDSATSLS